MADDVRATIEGPRLIVRGDTQIWLAAGWRADPAADGLLRLTRTAAGVAPRGLDPTRPIRSHWSCSIAGSWASPRRWGRRWSAPRASVNIKERLDFSCALFDADGGLVANAPHMPVHLGSMGASVRAVRARHPRLEPGEAFALNNPYAGGTHLPDITVVMPVFVGDGRGARPSSSPRAATTPTWAASSRLDAAVLDAPSTRKA